MSLHGSFIKVHEKLGLSFKNSRELNRIIDGLPAQRPRFKREEIVVAGESYDVHFRDIIECVRALYGDPEFARHLVFLPERHYADADHTKRLYHDMHTGNWWWAVQKSIEKLTPGATVMPIIISSDKTQVTLFGNKAAYPVYVTIGNLPKDIRSKPSQRGQVLLGYLPTAKLEHITNKAARRRTLANLFHACMSRILEPLRKPGVDGMAMTSGDGVTRRVHPILAAFVGDYPEQVLVTGVKSGQCPICQVPHDELGEHCDVEYPLRDINQTLDVLDTADESPTGFLRACEDAGIKPIYAPFWQHLPYADIYLSITPDILHQLFQGLVKHLVSWIKSVYVTAEIDARCRSLPPNHNLRLFLKGITPLSRLTGREHSHICRVLLGLIIDMRLPENLHPGRLVLAVRAMLDFVYLSQYPVHSGDSLNSLQDALRQFHTNKDVFLDLGIRSHFNFPKLHFPQHYRFLIESLGSADNFNTEYTERLHIDFAKDAYRASNHKDEFPQMTLWLERKEKILRHEQYMQWCQLGRPALDVVNPLHAKQDSHVKMTRYPSAKAVSFDHLASAYGARDFRLCLSRFIVRHNDPTCSRAHVEHLAANLRLNFRAVATYHKAKFWESDFPRYRHASDEYDVVHVTPSRFNTRQREVPGRFDTVLVNDGSGGLLGVQGYRIAQIRAIFSIPQREVTRLFPHQDAPRYLVYVEWFSPFRQPEPHHGMYKISRALRDGLRLAAVIPLENIRRSIHLYPSFGRQVPQEWNSSNVLELCEKFFANPFTDRHVYGTMF
ncbi:hypothetical protein PHLCEN_2v4327 [Hermanssonia centrifuga]|uniref:Uncharacterized protein n=1 Tax=Hermanssonia centrifuga TaxID=98765 RepID=A0A2R6PWB8_9APHY|nr:hypothetical protein PHLCEN_2v4327 [Hermanssonia centrifuga]